MKAYGRVAVLIHVFLISALVGGVWSASRSNRFTPGETAPYPMKRRLGEPQIGSGRYGEVKIIDPKGTRTPTPLSPSSYLVAIPTALLGIKPDGQSATVR
jgi:hypothetical protein